MSRRLYALALVLVCSLQSTAAIAGPTSSAHVPSIPIGEQLASTIRPMFAALSQTWMVAVITGQAERYTAEHTAAPRYVPSLNARPTSEQLNFSRTRMVSGWERSGTSHALNLEQLADPSRASKDPLVMTPQVVGCPAVVLRKSRVAMRATAHPNELCGPTPRPTVPPTPKPTPTPTPVPVPTPTPTQTPTPTPVPITPTPVPTATPVGALAPANTGINTWWTFEEGSIPGLGKWMLNVGNGNLVVQADDVDIPERGIDLAFRRTYNSESNHTSAGTDGSLPGVYGNGWTNTFDAHLAYNGTVMSVYDIDGARYDYTPDPSGCGTPSTCWSAPPGMQGTTLTWDGGCGYFWMKKTGTRYYFNLGWPRFRRHGVYAA